MSESQEYIDICNELAGRVMPDIEYIALLNTKMMILQANLEIYEGLLIAGELALEKLRAKADWRLKLLKRYDKGLQREPDCFSCGIMAFNEDTEMWEHADDCELGKELSDAD